MTQLFDKDYRVTEVAINARDRYFFDLNNGYSSIPVIDGECAVLDRVVVNNPMMTIKRDTTLNFVFKFKLPLSNYSAIQATNTGGVLPTYHPISNQYTAGNPNQQYTFTDDPYVVLPFNVRIYAANYTSSELATYITNSLNANYSKPLTFRNSKNELLTVAPNGTYNYQFRLKCDCTVVNNKLQFVFQLWNQSNAALASARPEFRASDTIAVILNNVTSGYTTYLYSNMANHDIYLSGEKWLLDKLGLDCQKSFQGLSIEPGDYVAPLYLGLPTNSPNIVTQPITGFNDILGYNGLSYVSQEKLTVTAPYLCDMKLGQSVYLCLSGFGPSAAKMYDSRGISRDAVHLINLKMFNFGSIIEENPAKWMYIGDKKIDNNFEVYFLDEDGDRVNPRDLNFIINIKIFSKNTKVKSI